MLTIYDIGAIVFYFAFMIAIAFIFRKQIVDTSEYFRGGGKMLWWMVGSSAFMSTFSAWTFSGAAGKAYTDGFPVIFLFLFNFVAFLICGVYFADKFRQLRVITPMEAVRQRFGFATEQTFTWFRIVSAWVTSALSLIAVSVFLSAIIGIDQHYTIIITGTVIVFMTLLGGSWAVISSDFIQCLLILSISVTTFFYTMKEGGGLIQIINDFPAESIVTGQGINYTEVFLLWVGAIFLQRVIGVNSMNQSVRFLSAKDGKHAKKAAYLAAVLFLFGSVMWFIPPIWAASAFPDLASIYPTLTNPNSGAYMVVVQHILPAGMIGLVVSAMFAASMSDLDSQINGCTAVLVKNFYVSVLRPNSTEKEQLFVSRIGTLFFGSMVILLALYFNQMQGFSLFQLMVSAMALVSMPVFIPQLLGIFVRRTPDWAGWGTLAFGVLISILSKYFITPEWWADALGIKFTSRETSDLNVVIPQIAHAVLTGGFFFATMFFYKEPVGQRKTEIELFFNNVATPIESFAGADAQDNYQRRQLGVLCAAFGGGITLMALIPALEPLPFVCVGGFILVVGFLLYRSSFIKTTEELLMEN